MELLLVHASALSFLICLCACWTFVLLIHCHLFCSFSQLYLYHSSPEFCAESSVLKSFWDCWDRAKGFFSYCTPAAHFAFLYRNFILTLRDTDTLQLTVKLDIIFFSRTHSTVVADCGFILLLLSFQPKILRKQKKSCYCEFLSYALQHNK